VEYRPPGERVPDSQYRLLLERIMSAGIRVPTRQGPPALTLMQQAMHFDLANGFPLITERSLKSFWRKSIGELCAFINGATTLAELADFGCDWWDPWATPEKTASRGLPPGSLGPGSYGGRAMAGCTSGCWAVACTCTCSSAPGTCRSACRPT